MNVVDRECIRMLMCQFRDAKRNGLAARRRLDVVVSIVDALVRKERERCAKICEGHGGWPAGECADKIRAAESANAQP